MIIIRNIKIAKNQICQDFGVCKLKYKWFCAVNFCLLFVYMTKTFYPLQMPLHRSYRRERYFLGRQCRYSPLPYFAKFSSFVLRSRYTLELFFKIATLKASSLSARGFGGVWIDSVQNAIFCYPEVLAQTEYLKKIMQIYKKYFLDISLTLNMAKIGLVL